LKKLYHTTENCATDIVQLHFGDIARQQMIDVKMTGGGGMQKEASRRFIDAWHRAENGETSHERHLAFESRDALARGRVAAAGS
jgi:hypothetical protein